MRCSGGLRLTVALFCAGGLLAPTPSGADPTSQPAVPGSTQQPGAGPLAGQLLLAQGLSLYSAGEFHKAIEVLHKAAAEAREPALLARVHAYLAVNYYVTNQREEAVRAFGVALQNDPALKLEIKQVGGAVLNLLEHTRARFRGLLMANTAKPRPGLMVFVDGVGKGSVPWSGRLRIGKHHVRLETRDGKWACETPAVVRIDMTTTVSCALERQTGKLTLTSSPSGAQVLIDGNPLGKTPLAEVRIPVGVHDIWVRRKGYEEQQRKVEVSSTRVVAVSIKLKRQLKPRPVVRRRGPDLRQRQARRRSRTMWAHISLGTGAALAITAAVLYGVGGSQGAEAHEQYMTAFDRSVMEAHYADVEAAQTKITAGHVLAGAALAAVGFSVYLYLTRPPEARSSRPRKKRAGAVQLAPAPGGLWLTGRF